MIKEQAAKNNGTGGTGRLKMPKALPDLSLIGVPEGQQNRAPGIFSYPQKFNGDAAFIWKKMFNDELFKAELKSIDKPEDQWYRAIMEFLKICGEIGAVPFSNVTQQELNDAVTSSLTSARIALVNFCDGVGLFQRVRPFECCVDYKIKEKGFGLVAWAKSRPVFDPGFEKWLNLAPNPRFIRSTDLKWVRHIQSNVNVWVRYVNPQRITIGYEIQVASPISVPGKRLATRKEIDAFVDRVIWKPIVRAHRFKDLKGRLF
jgi:hypothetical protein